MQITDNDTATDTQSRCGTYLKQVWYSGLILDRQKFINQRIIIVQQKEMNSFYNNCLELRGKKFVNYRTVIMQQRKINNFSHNWIDLQWKNNCHS